MLREIVLAHLKDADEVGTSSNERKSHILLLLGQVLKTLVVAPWFYLWGPSI